MNHAAKQQQGFTLVELVLAMSFISVLLLAIAMTIIQIGAVYNQGTTLKEINQASRDISEDLRRNISSARTVTLATDYVLTPSTSAPVGGRLCLGSYSYIWNYAKAPATDVNVTRYETLPNTAPAPVLVKVPDAGKIYCALNGGGLTYKNIRAIDEPQAQELLKTGDHSLGVHQFGFITPISVTASNDAIGQAMYSVQFTIGTNNVTALNADQSACLPPGTVNSNALYCNVQQFTLVVRAGK